MDVLELHKEFPKDAIRWRAQTITRDGSKALALAYLDARDVMHRLDEVCGAANWQDRYEVHGQKTICYISIRIGDDWITKADGAGDTAVEAEKGGISDAFKRAAVKWGIGRYLYAIDAPWVPCTTYAKNGKKYWSDWTRNPWDFVKGAQSVSAAEMKRGLADIDNDLLDCGSTGDVDKCARVWAEIMTRDNWSDAYRNEAKPKFQAKRDAIND